MAQVLICRPIKNYKTVWSSPSSNLVEKLGVLIELCHHGLRNQTNKVGLRKAAS